MNHLLVLAPVAAYAASMSPTMPDTVGGIGLGASAETARRLLSQNEQVGVASEGGLTTFTTRSLDVAVCDGRVTMVVRKTGSDFHRFAASVSETTRRHGTPNQELEHDPANEGLLPNSRMYFRWRDQAGNVYALAYRMTGEHVTTSEALVAAEHAKCLGGG